MNWTIQIKHVKIGNIIMKKNTRRLKRIQVVYLNFSQFKFQIAHWWLNQTGHITNGRIVPFHFVFAQYSCQKHFHLHFGKSSANACPSTETKWQIDERIGGSRRRALGMWCIIGCFQPTLRNEFTILWIVLFVALQKCTGHSNVDLKAIREPFNLRFWLNGWVYMDAYPFWDLVALQYDILASRTDTARHHRW